MSDPVVNVVNGYNVYKDKNGHTYTVINGLEYGQGNRLQELPEWFAHNKPNPNPTDPEYNKGNKSNNNKALKEKDINMVGDEGLVTRNELMKRDMDTMRKELEAKIAANKEVDLEIKGKVQKLDEKQCVGDECIARMEKKQDEMFKGFAEAIKALAEPRFVCKNCHSSSIKKGDKVCPMCGDPVVVDWV